MTVKTIPIEIPEKLIRILDSKAKFIVIIGGRGSAKSESVGRIMLMKAQLEGADVLCGREYQNSIDDSVHKLLSELIAKLDIPGAKITEKKIDFIGGGGIRYKGFSHHSAAVRSAQGFKFSWIEEAQDLSKKSIDDLLPTIRATGSQLIFTANPQASNDPFSQRFIVPFKAHLDKFGFYEDATHLVIVMNWRDNPWHGELEKQRLWDYEHMIRAEYDHIWDGAFNDMVQNSIIRAEWFDAAVDGWAKLSTNKNPDEHTHKGIKVIAHDPSDTGNDAKGLCFRHGNAILGVWERDIGDVNDGCDWATGYAIEVDADLFVWDGDGMGISLKRQVAEALEGKRTQFKIFKGSEGPEKPEEMYLPNDSLEYAQGRKNKDTFRNKRAQTYWRLRDLIYNSYRAIIKGEYVDPDDMIFISSKIKCLAQLRSEICRIPKKANGRGMIQIMTKEEMLRIKIASPNLADSVMMSLDHNIKPKGWDPNIPISIPEMKRF